MKKEQTEKCYELFILKRCKTVSKRLAISSEKLLFKFQGREEAKDLKRGQDKNYGKYNPVTYGTSIFKNYWKQ